MSTCLPDLLARQAQLQGEASAVVCGDGYLTFDQLNATSKQVGAYLHALGVASDDRVGLYVDPSLDLVVGAWGILCSGAAYLPLAPEYPDDRLRYMLEDSGATVILTQDHLMVQARELAPAGTRVVTLADAAQFHGEEAPDPVADSLAYVIYTSGSTGKPKGVMIEHRSIVSQMRWMHSCMGVGPGSTVLQKTAMSFDAAQWEILSPGVGSRVVIAEPGVYRDPEALIATIRRYDVTMLQCVPILLQALIDTGDFSACTSLTTVFSGGEALSRGLAQAFAGQLPSVSLVNLYGPTECTINSTACLVDRDSVDNAGGMVSVGVPVDNTQCFILDPDRTPVPIGEIGELYIGGIQLARGYLNRPKETEQRFVPSPFVPTERLYRTGDLAYWNPDGTIQFSGRTDNQVKLRGHRVELEEIALTIEEHNWVKHASALVIDNARTGSQDLIACVELDAKEAALMDQGNHGGHHQSKADKLQVKAQLSNPGLRDPSSLAGLAVVPLPCKQETARQRQQVFSRKSFRFYEGGKPNRAQLLELLAPLPMNTVSRSLHQLTFSQLGEILRWFGQYHSDERLLPKYAYASPGALYATQLYLEASGLEGVEAGYYYYHPVQHSLVRIASLEPGTSRLLVHFVGKRSAIEPVYRNNIREVLEFEAGHMIGVFENILPDYGFTIRPAEHQESAMSRFDVADEDYYLATFEISQADGLRQADSTEVYLQAHRGRVDGLDTGLYRYVDGELEWVSHQLVQAKHVIAINQQVHDRAAFGIAIVSRGCPDWLEYLSLGTRLHHLQRNGLGIGLMSAGYSSKSGHPLPAARRIDEVLGIAGLASGTSYFCLGGLVSDEQVRSEGMYEDSVHMKGPAEIIKEDLARSLPQYMIPARVLVLDRLPLTVNGKVDRLALQTAPELMAASKGSAYVAPTSVAEIWLAEVWGSMLKYQNVSVDDEFFGSGGNSLAAVSLIHRINRELGTTLPLQVIFQHQRLGDLAALIGGDAHIESSRLILLRPGTGLPIFCWPGLGGYPMNLRLLANEAGIDRPFYGIQAFGINPGETPYGTNGEMAAADIAEIRRVQPEGPYTLLGYSFGARLAFEAAWQLEQDGVQVGDLLLVCPGNPQLADASIRRYGREASFDNPAYVTILHSVFAGSIIGPQVERCLAQAHNEDSFVAFVHSQFPDLGEQTIRRITRIVEQTYEFDYSFDELAQRTLATPVTIFKAAGDDYSFIEGRSGYSAAPPTILELHADHYGVLKPQGIPELTAAVRVLLDRESAAI